MSLGRYTFGDGAIGSIKSADSGVVAESLFYFGTKGFTSLPTDSESNRHFTDTVDKALLLKRSAIDREFLGGALIQESGSIQINNHDGILDAAVGGYAFDGRSFKIESVSADGSYDNAAELYRGKIERVRANRISARFDIRTRGNDLDLPIQTDLFDGTSAEGGDNLKNKPKPIPFGIVRGISPPYLGIISGLHSYFVGENISDVTAAYDAGVALTKVSGTPSLSEFSINTTTGLLAVGGDTESVTGRITCDVEGYAPNGVLKKSPADILRTALEDYAGITSIDGDAFNNLESENASDMGIYVGPQTTSTGNVILPIIRSLGAFAGFNRQGQFTVKIIKSPTGASRWRFGTSDILEIELLPAPDIIDPPAWQYNVGYQRNYTVTDDVVAGSAESQRQFMAKEYREVSAENTAIQVKHLFSKPIFIPALYDSSTDAQTEANRLQALYGDTSTTRGIWRVTARNVSHLLDLGHTVDITYPRFSLNAKKGMILGLDVDLSTKLGKYDIFV